MKHKLSAEDRKTICRRVLSGEKQSKVAKDEGVSPGYVSKLVKSERNRVHISREAKPKERLTHLTPEQLQNLYESRLRDIETLTNRKTDSIRRIDHLKVSITTETSRLKVEHHPGVRAAIQQTISSYRSQISALAAQKENDTDLRDAHQSIADILTECLDRGVSV